jgi:heat-inducible transcriptional repressor
MSYSGKHPASPLDERSAKVLKAVVESYMQSAEPVGARAITSRYGFNLCPATIRNVMAELEDEGFLYQPRATAGRAPSDKGYRYYAVEMVTPQPLPPGEMRDIREAAHGTQWREAAELLGSLSRTLAQLSRQASLIGVTSWGAAPITQIRFVSLNSTLVMAVIVALGGEIQNQLLTMAEPYPQDDLDRLSNYFNARFSGLTLERIREKIKAEIAGEKHRVDALLTQALLMARLMEEKSALADSSAFFVDGASNLLGGSPELDIAGVKTLLKTFEQRGRLIVLLNECLKGEGLNLIIGSELELEGFGGCSLVTHVFKSGEGAVGCVGILGPKTMDYGRIMSLVTYAAGQVSVRLNG